MPSLNVIFNANSGPYAKELKSMQSMTSAWTSRIAGFFTGMIGVGAITALVKSTIDWSSKLRDTADNLQVNVEWLQKMQNGAMLTGGSIEDLSKLIGKLNLSRANALQHPGKGTSQAFNRLGMSEADIRNLPTQQFVDKLVKAFKGGATTQMTNDLSAVGGKSARNLIAAFSAQFQNDIPVLAEQMIDELDNMGDALQSLKTTLMVDVAPAIVATSHALEGFLSWIKQIGGFLGATSVGNADQLNRDATAGAVLQSAKVTAWASNLNRPLTDREKGLVEKIMAGSRDVIARASMNTPGQIAIDISEEERKKNEALAAGQRAERDARHKRENSAPGFDDLLPTSKDKFKFLGGDLTSNQKVGAYALPGATTLVDINRSMNDKLGSIAAGIDNMNDKLDNYGGGDEDF